MTPSRSMVDANRKDATVQTILCILLFTTMSLGEELEVSTPYIPRPYAFTGLSINGAGYSSISGTLGGGLRVDSPRLISNVEVGYNGARKANDGTIDNRNGSTRSVQARTFYRLSNQLYIGGGAQWTQLSTTNYAKQAWHPTLGIGKDFLRNTYSLRLQGMYILKGTDKINGSQGPEVSLTYPSPHANHHIFVRSVLGIYYFHTTITDFANQSLVKSQGGAHQITGYMMYNLIFRL